VQVYGGYGVYVCSGRVAYIARGVRDFVEVADSELRGMGFEGGEAVTEVGDSEVGRWRAVRGRLRTEAETAERRARHI
jgi:hypothetical protein